MAITRNRPQVVTGNALMEGDVVFFTARNTWSRDLSQAAVAKDTDAADALLTAAKAQPAAIVGPYLAAVEVDGTGTPRTQHIREAIRTTGPTVRLDLGKQAEPLSESAVPLAA
ncbi:MAG: DUF2849 domain-containing protein [Pseudomonadota bacterium]